MLKTRRMLAAIMACICSLALLAACGRSEVSVSNESNTTTETTATTTVTTEKTTEAKSTETKGVKKTSKTEGTTSTKTTTTTPDDNTEKETKAPDTTEAQRRQATRTETQSRQQTNQSATDPPKTNPPQTPPQTQPPVTDPPITDPPKTDPPQTQPPVTDPPKTDPPVTDPPQTQPPAFDPNSYNWAPIDYDNVDVNMANYTVNSTLYLDKMLDMLFIQECNNDPNARDTTTCNMQGSSISIHRSVDYDPIGSIFDADYSYSQGDCSMFVNSGRYYRYYFSGSSGEMIGVSLYGQTGSFPKDEIRVFVRAISGCYGGIPDPLVNFGYTLSPS